jgi:uncharacterized phage protein (TIGR02220 family)
MAKHRMFCKKIVTSDVFTDMKDKSQLLYYHLNFSADDDGFVESPKKITRSIGARKLNYKELIDKKFIIVFDTYICVIKHFLIHNKIRKDRKTPTTHIKELSQLIVKDNDAYSSTKCQPKVNQETDNCQHKLSKVKLSKDNKEKKNKKEKPKTSKPKKEKIPYKEIIEDLNEVVGKNFDYKTKSSQDRIKARWNEGKRTPDFKTVHRNMFPLWAYDPDMYQYLRPSTSISKTVNTAWY